MKKKLLIYGAGGLGREVLSMINQLSDWEVSGFVDDVLPVETMVKGLPVLGNKSYLNKFSGNCHLIVAIGDPATKKKIISSIENKNVLYPILIHPAAVLQDALNITIGKGSIICAGCVLTCDITIGEHVLLNLNTTIGHDVRIGNYASLMTGVNIGGQVEIGDEVLIGSGSNVRNKTHVGAHASVGMGSVVIKNVLPSTIVAGVPAKKL
jgi:sugar O-acyltransferase (sialic acid O-acetyltransferase NeuD family)